MKLDVPEAGQNAIRRLFSGASRRDIGCCLALAAVVLAIYWPMGSFEFVGYDDPDYVSKNPVVRLGLTWEGLGWAFHAHSCNWHPLTWLSHMLDCQLFGMNAGAHHWVNLCLHATNAMLVFAALRVMTGRFWPSAFAAGLFATHPLRVESVAWIAERKDLLCGFFFLLAVWAYGRGARLARAPAGPQRDQHLFFRLSLVFAALACLSKPMAVTLPFVLLLLDYWPLNRLPEQEFGARLKRLIVEKRVFFAMSFALSVATFLAQKEGGAMSPSDALSLGARLANVFAAYARYLGKTLFPTDLCCLYLWTYTPAVVVVAAAALFAGITVAAFALRRRHPYLIIGWLWFAGMLVPVIGVVQVGAQSMADRYSYLPSIGLSLMAVWWIADIVGAARHGRRLAFAGGGALLLACAAASAVQAQTWRNTEALMGKALKVDPRNYIALSNLGCVAGDKNLETQALELFRRAEAINPSFDQALSNLGYHLFLAGDYAESLKIVARLLRLKPPDGRTLATLGLDYFGLGKTNEAVSALRAAVRADPAKSEPRISLADVLNSLGRTNEAQDVYQNALKALPNNPEIRMAVAEKYMVQGRLDDALPHYFAAVNASPNDTEYLCALANALGHANRRAEASVHYRRALRNDPDCLPALSGLAQICAVSTDPALRNPARAVELAGRACELTSGTNLAYLKVLETALAQAGELETATTIAARSRDIALANRDEEAARQAEARIARYQSRPPGSFPH